MFRIIQTAAASRRGLFAGRARRIFTAAALLAGLCGGAIATGTSTASAVAFGPLCEGYVACSVAPYSAHGFQNVKSNSYWAMNPGTSPGYECTNYVAWVESSVYGVAAPDYNLNADNATGWAAIAQAHGVTVNQTPTVGSVAQWRANANSTIGSDGHVAVVEQVGPNDSYIVISQQNWSSDVNYYGWAEIPAGTTSEKEEPWPDHFLHFRNTRGISTLSVTQPDRLVQSTGNLYWTADRTATVIQGGVTQETDQADFYRASKDNQPGQEQILYQESLPATATARSVDFEAITYANVDGTWYGYFVANYSLHNESQIKRVPLSGGAAVVLATSPAVIGNRDLVTDGSLLYWADAGGIRKVAITGGTVETLVPGGTFAHLGLDGSSLYYSSGNSILHVPTSGGPSSVLVSAASAITAIYPPSATNGNVYWGESNGSVSLFPGPHDSVDQIQAPRAGVSVTSVSVADDYILWGDCFVDGCQVGGYDNGNVVSVPTSGPPVDVQGDAGAWYWGDSQLEKFTL
jgi:surface antigen